MSNIRRTAAHPSPSSESRTLIDLCRLTKEGKLTCANVVKPPKGTAAETCTLSSDCQSGQICDFGGNVCRFTCETE
jgi:hypothetical protein